MRKPFCVTEDLDAAGIDFHKNVDTETRAFNMRPVWVYGAGYSLFSAVTVALCGCRSLSAVLRVRIVVQVGWLVVLGSTAL